MRDLKKPSGILKKVCVIIYALIFLFVSLFLFKRPAYNWDILPYMGVILLYDNYPIDVMHTEVYKVAKDQIPSKEYNRLSDLSKNYRGRMALNSNAFYSQLPFYIVKPLYTRTCWLLYKAGMSLTRSTMFPSIISYFFISLLLFHWLQKYLSLIYAFAGSVLIMLSSPVISVATLSTPDALSGLLLFAAVYTIVEKKRMPVTWVLLLLSIFARVDNILPASVLLVITFFKNDVKPNVYSIKLWGMILGMMFAAFLIAFKAHHFGWSPLYYPTFIKQLNVSYESLDAFSLPGYIDLVKSQLMTGLYFSSVMIFAFLMLLLLANPIPARLSELSHEETIAVAFAIIMLIRFILHPVIADRLYIAWYLSVFVFLAKKYAVWEPTFYK